LNENLSIPITCDIFADDFIFTKPPYNKNKCGDSIMVEKEILMDISSRLGSLETSVKDLTHAIKGNGKPGLITEFNDVKRSHTACQERHKEEALQAKENKVVERQEMERRERKLIAFASIVVGVVVTVISTLYQEYREKEKIFKEKPAIEQIK
jgi:hypothetical protein